MSYSWRYMRSKECVEQTRYEQSIMWAFDGPPYWLRIGPINWEGKY